MRNVLLNNKRCGEVVKTIWLLQDKEDKTFASEICYTRLDARAIKFDYETVRKAYVVLAEDD